MAIVRNLTAYSSSQVLGIRWRTFFCAAGLVVFGLAGFAGCHQVYVKQGIPREVEERFEQASWVPVMVGAIAREGAAEAEKTFDRAVFCKPENPWAAEFDAILAPLIIREVSEEDRNTTCGFGAITTFPDGTVVVEPDLPIVYYRRSAVSIHGAEHDQWTFVWAYPPALHAPTNEEGIRIRAVRMTLGTDGFPLVWEIFHVAQEYRYFFVSAALEQRAAEQFGSPLPGRRFSIERDPNDNSIAIVVRVLDDGPVPMGPYVYLESDVLAITTVLCRCMPSQVDEIMKTESYELLPVESLDAEFESRIMQVLHRLRGGGTGEMRVLRDDGNPARLLRWPK